MPPRSKAAASPKSASPSPKSPKKARSTQAKDEEPSSLGWRASLLLVALVLTTVPTLLQPDHIPSTWLQSRRSLAKLRTLLKLEDSDIPASSQIIDTKSHLALDDVTPPTPRQYTELFIPPGMSLDSMLERPFHVYDPEFYSVLGSNPTLTRIAETESDPLFHEAVVWYPPTDEMFFVQNAGAAAAGTGLHKSAIIQKISLAQAAQAASVGKQNNTNVVKIEVVNTDPIVLNPNGAINYRGELVFAAEGQGDKPSAVQRVNPVAPYNSSILINNYFGRQFNSINDLAVHPITGDLHFTDVTYGWLQSFRPSPGLPSQVYKYDEATGLVSVVADGFNKPNGITFSPDGKYAYVSDTGASQGTRFPADPFLPSTIYRFTVSSDGLWHGRTTFAYVSPGPPDGIHCDSNGNVHAGCGDGVHVFNPSGKLIGKIFVGGVVANFQFARNRMVICAETSLWYAELGVTGPDIAYL